MSIRRLLFMVALLAILGLGFEYAFRTPPVAVELATISRGDVVVTVEDEGVARIREVFTVSAPVAGAVLRTPLDVGDRVEKNETVVAVMEPQAPQFLDARQRREAEAAVGAAEAAMSLAVAQLRRARAEETYWRAELTRSEKLRAASATPERAVDQARLELSVREAAVQTAVAGLDLRRRELEAARARLIEPNGADKSGDHCCVTIRSPSSGRVLSVEVESAQVVAPGAPLVTLGDPADMEIVVDLLSADAVRVKPGAAAHVTRWGGAAVLDAQVERVEPVGFAKVSALGVEEQRVNVVLTLTSPQEAWAGLGHDYRVMVEIETARVASALRLPLGALFRAGPSWAVFAVEDGAATLRKVDIGARNGDMAEVVSGLAEGDVVILHPSDRIEEGTRVERRAE